MLLKAQATAKKTPYLKAVIFSSFLFGALGSLSGCSSFKPYKAAITQGNVITQESLSLIQEGLNQQQVRKLLGPPIGQNAFNPYHWEYIFYTTDPESNVEAQQHLVLQFDETRYLTHWEVKDNQVKLKKDESLLGLGLF